MIIFLKGMLPTLDFFVDYMSKDMEDTYVFDVSDDMSFFKKIEQYNDMINEKTHVITFNNVGISLSWKGKNYWESKNVRLHNILVDAPSWYRKILDRKMHCMQIITVDREHKNYIEEFYPECKVEYLPLAGVAMEECEEIPFEERKIEVLYVGARQNMNVAMRRLDFLPDSGLEFLEVSKNLLIKYPFLSAEKMCNLYLDEKGLKLERTQKMDCISALYESTVSTVRGYYQGAVVEALAKAGIHVDIFCPTNWRDLEEKYPEYVHVHESIMPEECTRVMQNTKITLNIQPWFKYGSHDRIYNAMLNNSVCVTDTSEYLVQNFRNGENIVFYELNNLDGLVKNVKTLLDNPWYANMIIKNQKKWVEHSTWRDRLYNILEQRFEEGKDFL